MPNRVQVGFGERVNLLLGDGPRNPLWTSFEALGLHVAFYLDNVPLNWCVLGRGCGRKLQCQESRAHT